MKYSINKLLKHYASYYPKGNNIASTTPFTFYAKDLKIQTTKSPKHIPPFDAKNLTFGKHSSDHMIVIDSDHEKWSTPKIVPYAPLQLDPFNSSLHYAIQCFQGLKAYKDNSGKIRLFRPECNMKRFKASTKRVALPDFDGEELIKCIEQLVRLEQKWIPPISGFSLYLRPFHISMEQSLGVKQANKSKIVVVASPAGPYYQTGVKPIKLATQVNNVRSCHKGTGGFKIGGNYSPTLNMSVEAGKKGYHQVLWLYGQQRNEQVIEVGASNIFFVSKTSNSKIKQILTPQLEDLILPGVTRDSIIELMRTKPQYIISERIITMKEILDRISNKELLECFGAGTAVIVSPIQEIEYRGQRLSIPINPKFNAGDVSYQIRNELLGIQEGRVEDKFGWIRFVN